MIGTNNLSCNTDDEIIRGIAHLVAVIARHQPSAGVEVIGLLPRRGMEDRVSGVNTKLEEKIRSMNLTFRNPGTLLLGKGGKIDESLFRDGLHPNEKGYGRIAPVIAGME
jgi:lysophospholipase L1-like esterase